MDSNIPEKETVDLSEKYDFCFVCVPTDSTLHGSCDISIVESVIKKVNADIFILKSAVPPLTHQSLTKNYNKKIVISPEYYGCTQHSNRQMNFVILGGDRESCGKVATLYGRVKNGSYRIQITNPITAELAKYMENCFLALKVTFCCEFADIAKKYGVCYPELRELFILDERMGSTHTFVYPEKPYYDSHCLNKDVSALINFAGDSAPLMQCMHKINLERKKS
jgi:nucleotide sugar dehydrogenase